MSCNQTLREAQAIALKGSTSTNSAIANGSFSDYFGFIKSGLRIALSTISNIISSKIQMTLSHLIVDIRVCYDRYLDE